MAFRADEAEVTGYERALRYLAPKNLAPSARPAAERALNDMIEQCGPVVDGYPIWHPLVPQRDPKSPITRPDNDEAPYKGLDHTVYFAHGFVTCPYNDGSQVIESVKKMTQPGFAEILAEKLDVILYNEGTTAIFVKCEWYEPLSSGHMIPKRLAVPLMIEQEMRAWRGAEVGESWETMRPYLLGTPHGSRSSLFVSQETALAMKRTYMSMVESGMFGPLLFR